MQIVTVAEVRVLQASRQLRLPEAGAYLKDTIPMLEAEARSRRLTFAGPWTFVSHNLPQDTETMFRLAICRPITGDGEAHGQFRIVTLPEFHCAALEYEGPLSGIYAGGYVPLLDAIFTGGLPLTGEIREVHHVRDTPESPVNQVEIQIGIAPAPSETAAAPASATIRQTG